MAELTDGTIVLRMFHDDDVARITEACSDPVTQRFTVSLPSPYTEEDARAYLAIVAESALGDESRKLAIADANTGVLLGAIEVRLGAVGTIGYWVAPDARGQGIATRALVLLARWAVLEGGVERLELTTHPENRASQRVAEKAGFTREGVLRAYVRFREGRRDSVMFSLLPGDVA